MRPLYLADWSKHPKCCWKGTETHRQLCHSREPRKCSHELKYAFSIIQHISNETRHTATKRTGAFLAVIGCGSNLNIHGRSSKKLKLHAHVSERPKCGQKQRVNIDTKVGMNFWNNLVSGKHLQNENAIYLVIYILWNSYHSRVHTTPEMKRLLIILKIT